MLFNKEMQFNFALNYPCCQKMMEDGNLVSTKTLCVSLPNPGWPEIGVLTRDCRHKKDPTELGRSKLSPVMIFLDCARKKCHLPRRLFSVFTKNLFCFFLEPLELCQSEIKNTVTSCHKVSLPVHKRSSDVRHLSWLFSIFTKNLLCLFLVSLIVPRSEIRLDLLETKRIYPGCTAKTCTQSGNFSTVHNKNTWKDVGVGSIPSRQRFVALDANNSRVPSGRVSLVADFAWFPTQGQSGATSPVVVSANGTFPHHDKHH